MELVDDRAIAHITSMSPSWVRKQRWLRRHNQEHIFTITPIMIGTSPRYRIEDVEAWINELEVAND